MITIYTDGSCSGNPGPGGWAFIAIQGAPNTIGKVKEISAYGPSQNTTNQRMEIAAVIEGVSAVRNSFPKEKVLVIISDSAYVCNCFNQLWYETWQRNNWMNSKKKPVSNRDLWEKLLSELKNYQFKFQKVAGHSGDAFNEAVDIMARQGTELAKQENHKLS